MKGRSTIVIMSLLVALTLQMRLYLLDVPEASADSDEQAPVTPTVYLPSADTLKRTLRLPQDRACTVALNTLVTRGIKVVSANKDAGLISAGPILIRNINRSDLTLAFRCGFVGGAGEFPLQCLDFLAHYQILIQPNGEEGSTLTIQVSVTGLDDRGIPRGKITYPLALRGAVERLDGIISPELSQ